MRLSSAIVLACLLLLTLGATACGRPASATPSIASSVAPNSAEPADAPPARSPRSAASAPKLTSESATLEPATSPSDSPPVTVSTAAMGVPAASPTPQAQLRQAFVANTDGEGVYLRRTMTWSDRLEAWLDGTRLEVLAENVDAQSVAWLQVRTPNQQVGFVPAQFVADRPPATATPAPKPSPSLTTAKPVASATPTAAPKPSVAPTKSAPVAAATPTPIATVTAQRPAPAGTFTIGSTKSEVQAAQGTPKTMSNSFWSYGLATVDFVGERVVGWSNIGGELRASLPGAGSRQGGTFTIGSTREQVAATHGVPTGYRSTFWSYNLATIDFEGDKVVGWSNIGGALRPALAGAGARPEGTFSVGSTQADVLAVQGVPTSYHSTWWSYELATVNFQGDRVTSGRTSEMY